MTDQQQIKLLATAKELLAMSAAGHVWCRADLQRKLKKQIEEIEQEQTQETVEAQQ